MKKLAGLLCAVALFACLGLLAGCGGGKYANDPHLGTWECETVTILGVEMPAKDVYADGWTIELKADGNAQVNVNGTESPLPWQPTEDGTGFVLPDMDNMTFTDVDENTVSSEFVGCPMTFKKTS